MTEIIDQASQFVRRLLSRDVHYIAAVENLGLVFLSSLTHDLGVANGRLVAHSALERLMCSHGSGNADRHRHIARVLVFDDAIMEGRMLNRVRNSLKEAGTPAGPDIHMAAFLVNRDAQARMRKKEKDWQRPKYAGLRLSDRAYARAKHAVIRYLLETDDSFDLDRCIYDLSFEPRRTMAIHSAIRELTASCYDVPVLSSMTGSRHVTAWYPADLFPSISQLPPMIRSSGPCHIRLYLREDGSVTCVPLVHVTVSGQPVVGDNRPTCSVNWSAPLCLIEANEWPEETLLERCLTCAELNLGQQVGLAFLRDLVARLDEAGVRLSEAKVRQRSLRFYHPTSWTQLHRLFQEPLQRTVDSPALLSLNSFVDTQVLPSLSDYPVDSYTLVALQTYVHWKEMVAQSKVPTHRVDNRGLSYQALADLLAGKVNQPELSQALDFVCDENIVVTRKTTVDKQCQRVYRPAGEFVQNRLEMILPELRSEVV